MTKKEMEEIIKQGVEAAVEKMRSLLQEYIDKSPEEKIPIINSGGNETGYVTDSENIFYLYHFNKASNTEKRMEIKDVKKFKNSLSTAGKLLSSFDKRKLHSISYIIEPKEKGNYIIQYREPVDKRTEEQKPGRLEYAHVYPSGHVRKAIPIVTIENRCQLNKFISIFEEK